MVTIVSISLTLAALSGLVAYIFRKVWNLDRLLITIVAFLGLMIGCIVGPIVAFATGYGTVRTQVVTTHYIVPLHDGTGRRGSYFLGLERVDGGTIIHYATQSDHGDSLDTRYRDDKNPTVTINFDDSGHSAELDEATYTYYIDGVWFMLPFGQSDEVSDVFTVPTGSVTTCSTQSATGTAWC